MPPKPQNTSTRRVGEAPPIRRSSAPRSTTQPASLSTEPHLHTPLAPSATPYLRQARYRGRKSLNCPSTPSAGSRSAKTSSPSNRQPFQSSTRLPSPSLHWYEPCPVPRQPTGGLLTREERQLLTVATASERRVAHHPPSALNRRFLKIDCGSLQHRTKQMA